MNDKLLDSEKLSETRRVQRDSAITQRDSAIQERDDARLELDESRGQNTNLENNKAAQELFVATLSHDLRNPISAIKMAIELMRDNPNADLLKEMIDLVDRNADQAGELISHLLDAHLVRSGAPLPIEKEECEILALLQKCHQALGPHDQSKIEISSYNGQAARGYWDPRALERVFKNLINNAIKFSEVDRDIKIYVAQGSQITNISFQNYGETISLENQLRIFDSQVRVQQTEVKQKRGWGLGLTLVRGIAEAHSGKVEVASSKLEGTIFTLKIPNDTRLPL